MLNDEGKELYEFKLKKRQLDLLNKFAARKLYSNRDHYNSMSDLVCTPEGMVPSNPEYRARMERTKKLRDALKTYSGDKDCAEDILFDLKKRAEKNGLDFNAIALDKLYEIKGKELPKTLHTINRESLPEREPSPFSMWVHDNFPWLLLYSSLTVLFLIFVWVRHGVLWG
jgi:hypothetical protein